MNKFYLYMKMAIDVSSLSPATRRKVGCVFVKNDAVISTGYNNIPPMYGSCEEDGLVNGESRTKKELVHAEMYAIHKMVKNKIDWSEAQIYCTTSPCMECAKLLYYHGISNVIFLDKYRDTEPISYLSNMGVSVKHLESPELMEYMKSAHLVPAA